MTTATPPDLSGLPSALEAARVRLDHAAAARDGTLAGDGGDVGAGGARLVTRHVANYLAALDLARRRPAVGAVADIGSGVGALGAWVAEELESPLWLVDRSAPAREVAQRAFPRARVVADVEQVPSETARLVTAMEVIEHVPPREQAAFVRGLARLLAPGGVLVLSTPDESGYLGGWSGYRPHVGPLGYTELVALLGRNSAWPAVVWRLEGQPFRLGRVRAVAEPLVNRVWGLFEAGAPRLTARMLGAGAAAGNRRSGRRRVPGGRVPPVHASDDPAGGGTGLLGVVVRPELERDARTPAAGPA